VLKRVSVAEAEDHLADLLAEIQARDVSIVIERDGRPIAALVAPDRIDGREAAGQQGALALVGGWGELPDEAIDALVSDIYAARERDLGRSVDLGE
jgi:antitoxin (DNA-binding transcriptional repressor) of toxin-antitoxin stability system